MKKYNIYTIKIAAKGEQRNEALNVATMANTAR